MAIVRTGGEFLAVEPTLRHPPTATEPASARPPRVAPGRRRRRPSGEAPPLPRALHTSGR